MRAAGAPSAARPIPSSRADSDPAERGTETETGCARQIHPDRPDNRPLARHLLPPAAGSEFRQPRKRIVKRRHRSDHLPPVVWVPYCQSCLGPGQLQPEPGSFPNFRFQPHSAPHPLDRLLHDGQANTRALVAVSRVQSLENAEDPLLILLLDADAIVLEPNAHVGTDGLRTDTHLGLLALGNKLDR